MGSYYADIIVDIIHEKLDRTFQYRIPEELRKSVQVGSQVEIPFGNGNRQFRGYVIGISTQPRYEPKKIKSILTVDSDELTVESRLILLAEWMKLTYGSTMIQALKTVIPIRRKTREREERFIVLAMPEEKAKEKLAEFENKHQKARARVAAGLIRAHKTAYGQALKEWKATAEVLKSLEGQGLLKIVSRIAYRNPIAQGLKRTLPPALTDEQSRVFARIMQEWEEQKRTCLIQGVTGSGKTLIYMELMARVLEQGRQAILLIPEIALTYQNVERFYSRFGDCVTVLNSRMSQGERFDQMERARKSDVQIIIGPRSALFTPFPNLGLIILDEEHETSYKSEGTPRFHARETAVERARLENAHVVLGSATPSVETYYRCKRGEYALVMLESRYQKARLPRVYSVDMREELKSGNRSILSRALQASMGQRLQCGEQTMLFLNRRGFAGFVSCRSCGHVMKCPHCDVSLTVHNHGRLVCHYCGYQTNSVIKCPACGSPYIGGFRAGTQQIEQLVRRSFPKARVMRMDLDTTRGKDGYQKILEAFARQEADILIGTQMIVKGHDFPQVTLMGVLSADLSLYASDYRAAERTYQLLVQAVGRAGRGALAGEAVIQTYHPEHYSIRSAIRQDYEEFFSEEISYRKLLGYPPACNLLAVHGACEDEVRLGQAMEYMRRFLVRIRGAGKVQMIGPAAESVSRINDMYREVLYVRTDALPHLLAMREKLESYIKINKGFDSVYVQFDLNT